MFTHKLDSGKSHVCFGVSQWTWIVHESHPSSNVKSTCSLKTGTFEQACQINCHWQVSVLTKEKSNNFQGKAVQESRKTEMLCGSKEIIGD